MPLSETHWETLRVTAHLKAWVVARELGLTVQQCDAIADAAVDAVRLTLEFWEAQPATA